MQDLKILLVIIGILLAPCFKRDYLILGTIIIVLAFLLLASGCAALLYTPLL
jgi:hypothetical protein